MAVSTDLCLNSRSIEDSNNTRDSDIELFDCVDGGIHRIFKFTYTGRIMSLANSEYCLSREGKYVKLYKCDSVYPDPIRWYMSRYGDEYPDKCTFKIYAPIFQRHLTVSKRDSKESVILDDYDKIYFNFIPIDQEACLYKVFDGTSLIHTTQLPLTFSDLESAKHSCNNVGYKCSEISFKDSGYTLHSGDGERISSNSSITYIKDTCNDELLDMFEQKFGEHKS